MTVPSAPPPIPGASIDPPAKDRARTLRRIEARPGAAAEALGIGYRALVRFTGARGFLLAAGTSYYLFLALFSLIAFAYGLVAIVGADDLARYLTEAITEAFPGLLGEEGLDPAQLRSVGQTASVVGLLVLLYAGSGAMVGASGSLRQIYGAPPDPRGFILARVRLLGWLLAIGPLIVLSYVASTVIASSAAPVLDAIGLESSGTRVVVIALSIALTLMIDWSIVYVLLGVLGGIRPPRGPRAIGAGVGAVAIEVLKYLMAFLVALSLEKPQYGALAVPIGVLFVLYLQTTALYASAALTAGIAERAAARASSRGASG
jgi:membrane protein